MDPRIPLYLPRAAMHLGHRNSAMRLARACRDNRRPREWVAEYVATARAHHAEAMRAVRPWRKEAA